MTACDPTDALLLQGLRPAIPRGAETLTGSQPFNTRLHAGSFRVKLTVMLRLTLVRQLQHGRALTFGEIGYQHNLTIRKFQRIVMGGRTIKVDLPETRDLVL